MIKSSRTLRWSISGFRNLKHKRNLSLGACWHAGALKKEATRQHRCSHQQQARIISAQNPRRGPSVCVQARRRMSDLTQSLLLPRRVRARTPEFRRNFTEATSTQRTSCCHASRVSPEFASCIDIEAPWVGLREATVTGALSAIPRGASPRQCF